MKPEKLILEISLKAIRSSGSGGQHVNKVSTKVELQFDVLNSLELNDEEKALIKEKLNSRLTKNGVLILQCAESRSQFKNKQLIKQRFLELIKESLIIPKDRIPTKIPRAVIKKRLTNKRQNSEKKANRKKPDLE